MCKRTWCDSPHPDTRIDVFNLSGQRQCVASWSLHERPKHSATPCNNVEGAEFRVPDVIATWQQDDTGLGVIAYEVVQETGQATDWREVGRIIRRLHTDIAPSEIPTGYPIATPTHLPWWNFGAILTRLEATALVPSQQLSTLHEAAERGAEWTNIVETTPNVLTHGDIHPGNILMSEDGPVLIDWDLLSTASPLWDHVPLKAWSTPPWQGNPDAYTAFAAGYGAVDWESDSLDVVVEMRNLAATVMKLIASASTGIIDEEAHDASNIGCRPT